MPISTYRDLQPYFESLDKETGERGLEHGIHLAISMKSQTENLYLDPQETMFDLEIKKHDLQKSIRETLKKCVEE